MPFDDYPEMMAALNNMGAADRAFFHEALLHALADGIGRTQALGHHHGHYLQEILREIRKHTWSSDLPHRVLTIKATHLARCPTWRVALINWDSSNKPGEVHHAHKGRLIQDLLDGLDDGFTYDTIGGEVRWELVCEVVE